MPDQPRSPDLNSMGGEVDRLLRQLNPDAERVRPPPRRPGAMRAGRPPHARPQVPAPVVVLPSRHGVWLRVALCAFLATAVTQWPYALCGAPLIGYLVAVAVVLVAGVWAAYAAWRRRMGIAHVVALAVILSGIALVTLQVLPRVGYAAVQTGWRCVG